MMRGLKIFIVLFSIVGFANAQGQLNPEYMKMVIGFTTYIQTNNMDSLQAMIDDGFSPNFQDKNKEANPLHYAISADRPQAMKKLVENGADWSYTNADNKTARTLMQLNYPELFKEINKKRLRNTRFLLAIQNGEIEEADELLTEELDVNYKMKDQSTALHLLLNYNLDAKKGAHTYDKFQLLNKLVDRNINAKVYNAKKEYPLFISIVHYPHKYTELLLNLDPTLPHKDLPAFAYFVSQAFDTLTVKVCLPHIENINMMTSNGKSIIYNALKKQNFDITNYILEAGANTETKNEIGQTVLSEIIADTDTLFDKITAVNLLIKHQADVNTTDKNAVTPLIYAVNTRNLEIAKILVAAGANVNYIGKGVIATENALLSAVSRADLPMVEFLIKAGAKNDVKDELGKSAFDKAKNAFEFHKEKEQKEKASTYKKIMKLVK